MVIHKKRVLFIALLAHPLIFGLVFLLLGRGQTPVHAQATNGCAACHASQTVAMTGSRHAGLACETCHEGAVAHEAQPSDPAFHPRVHFDMEVCQSCHRDHYDTFGVDARGRTVYGGSDDGPLPPKGWSKTVDLPYWNVLIDGHPFVLETYEDSPMAVNQIEHQETIRPGSEACMECHGTRAAFIKGFEYRDKLGMVHSIPATKTTVTLPSGATVDIPAKEYTVKYRAHTIYDGTSFLDPVNGEWTEAVTTITVPVGTRIWTYTDGVNLSGGAFAQKYQVKTLVTLPAPVTVDVLDKTGAAVGTVTFKTIATYPEAGADINGMTGFSSPVAADSNVATVARNWIYAVMEALAFDGLDYTFNDPAGHTHFTGGGANWPSVLSGELCNQCHDPHSGKLRIVRKALVAAIAERGINPYSPTGKDILTFEQASRQDQIIAVCAQCHSEYVGGYSANTGLDQDYFPWAKPGDLENQYRDLFGYLQDWSHGGPVVPWQSDNSNARGFLPYGSRYPIGAPLVKVQHPEAEVFFNSPMYNAGATCTDCHSTRIMRPDGTSYTSHWFASPLKLMQGFSGSTVAGDPVAIAAENPCQRCHTTDTSAQSQQRVLNVQDQFFLVQERTQVALVNALKYIKEQQDLGVDQAANIAAYQRASMRWELYTQAENSMGFHNAPEATTEVANARLWVDPFIPWPLTPVNVRITSQAATSLTLTFFDQAADEEGFRIERATSLEGPYTLVADLATPNGIDVGDVEFTDTGLIPGTSYFYRVSAYNAQGESVPSIWAQAIPQETVSILSVLYDAAAQTLTVVATSSNQPNVQLTAQGYGSLAWKSWKNFYRNTFTGVAAKPAGVTVTSSGGGSATYVFPPQDTVSIQNLIYNAAGQTLTVVATSSNQPNVRLTAQGYGSLAWKSWKNFYRTTFTGVAAKPAGVTVASSGGGTATQMLP